jgi:7-cyano-7-deazaguanine synthase
MTDLARPIPASLAHRPAVVLLSGGLDSATVLAIANQQNFDCYALSFRYGQRHTVELDAAERVAKTLGVAEHRIIDVDLRGFGGSALTDHAIDVPRGNPDAAGIPATYVPARNTVFLSYALAWAEAIDARDIFIGVNAVDYSGYPDCRPEFIKAFEAMANLATKAAVSGRRLRVRAPLIHRTKAEIIRLGLQLGVDYSITHSCYDPTADGRACGGCDSCVLRARGFAQNGVADPALTTGAAA